MARPSRIVLVALILGCAGPLLVFLRANTTNFPPSSYSYTLVPSPPFSLPTSSSCSPPGVKHLKSNQIFWDKEERGVEELAEDWAGSTWTSSEELPFLLFVHIPKTAGSSFKQLLWHLCDGRGGVVHNNQRFDFLGWSAEKQNSYCGLYGHFGIGIAEEEEWKVEKPGAYITFLRDPVSRTVSQYNYARRVNPLKFENSCLLLAGVRCVNHVSVSVRLRLQSITFDQFLSAKEKQKHFGPWSCINPATSQLARFWGKKGGEFAQPKLTREDLQRAKARLTAPMEKGGIELLGLVERYEDSIRMMEFKLGRRFPSALVGKETNKSRRPTDIHVPDLSDAQLRQIRRMSELDLELYEFGRKVFEARYAAMKGRILQQDPRMEGTL
ncbi:Capsular polysaccharide biosynthesis protein WcbF [Balamuthia mandrillaris]